VYNNAVNIVYLNITIVTYKNIRIPGNNDNGFVSLSSFKNRSLNVIAICISPYNGFKRVIQLETIVKFILTTYYTINQFLCK
jgi:hypothetical protein